MRSGLDWKRAMLNEAEASGDELWAEETRHAATFDPWEVTWRQLPPFFVAISLAALFMSWLSAQGFSWVSAAVCGGGSSSGCGASLMLTGTLLVLFYMVIGALFYRWNVRSLLLIVFVVIAARRADDMAVMRGMTSGLLWAGALGFLTVALPVGLGYRLAHGLGLQRVQ